MEEKTFDKIAWGLIIFFVLFLIFFGFRYHPVEEVHTAEEFDSYVIEAAEILQGNIPRDPIHPLLYHLLAAGAGVFLKDVFLGAKVISALAAGCVLLLTYRLGRSWFSRPVALWAMVALMMNYHTIREGMHATSDMTFTAWVMLTLFFLLRVAEDFSWRRITAAAFFFALACFTRYPGVFLIPAVLTALLFPIVRVSWRQRMAGCMIFAGAVVIFLLPHFFLTWYVFGNPFYNETWRSLGIKLYGGGDWTYQNRMPFDGLASIIFHRPGMFVQSAIRELISFVRYNMVRLNGEGIAGLFFSVLAVLGAAGAFFKKNHRAIILLSFPLFYISLVCLFFQTGQIRVIYPALPICCLSAGAALCLPQKDRIGGPVIMIMIVATLFLGYSTFREIPGFIARHPVKEVDAARRLEKEYGENIVVLGTFGPLRHYVKYRYYWLENASVSEQEVPARYYVRMEEIVQEKSANYLIVGKLSLARRPVSLLSPDAVPSFLRPVFHNSDVVVYRVEKSAP